MRFLIEKTILSLDIIEVFEKLELKQQDISTHLLEWLKFKTLKISIPGNDANHHELSLTPGYNANWNTHFGRKSIFKISNMYSSKLLREIIKKKKQVWEDAIAKSEVA